MLRSKVSLVMYLFTITVLLAFTGVTFFIWLLEGPGVYCVANNKYGEYGLEMLAMGIAITYGAIMLILRMKKHRGESMSIKRTLDLAVIIGLVLLVFWILFGGSAGGAWYRRSTTDVSSFSSAPVDIATDNGTIFWLLDRAGYVYKLDSDYSRISTIDLTSYSTDMSAITIPDTTAVYMYIIDRQNLRVLNFSIAGVFQSDCSLVGKVDHPVAIAANATDLYIYDLKWNNITVFSHACVDQGMNITAPEAGITGFGTNETTSLAELFWYSNVSSRIMWTDGSELQLGNTSEIENISISPTVIGPGLTMRKGESVYRFWIADLTGTDIEYNALLAGIQIHTPTNATQSTRTPEVNISVDEFAEIIYQVNDFGNTSPRYGMDLNQSGAYGNFSNYWFNDSSREQNLTLTGNVSQQVYVDLPDNVNFQGSANFTFIISGYNGSGISNLLNTYYGFGDLMPPDICTPNSTSNITDWYIGDINSGDVITYNSTFDEISRFPTNYNYLATIACNETDVWVTSTWIFDVNILHYLINGTYVDSISRPCPDVDGLTSNGTNLWVACYDYDYELYFYNSTYDLATTYTLSYRPRGVTTIDGTNFWITDPDNDLVHFTDSEMNDIENWSTKDIIDEYPYGIETVDGNTFWLTDSVDVEAVFKVSGGLPTDLMIDIGQDGSYEYDGRNTSLATADNQTVGSVTNCTGGVCTINISSSTAGTLELSSLNATYEITSFSGTNTITVYANVSSSDNLMNTTTRTFDIDAVAPTEPNITSPVNLTYSQNQSPLIDWDTSTDDNFEAYVMEIDDDPAFATINYTYYVTSGATNSSLVIQDTLNDSTWYFRIVANDTVNNKNTSVVLTYTVDTTDPVFDEALGNNVSGVVVLRDDTLNITANVTDTNLDNVTLESHNMTFGASGPTSAFVSVQNETYQIRDCSDSCVCNITATAWDRAGNSVQSSTQFTALPCWNTSASSGVSISSTEWGKNYWSGIFNASIIVNATVLMPYVNSTGEVISSRTDAASYTCSWHATETSVSVLDMTNRTYWCEVVIRREAADLNTTINITYSASLFPMPLPPSLPLGISIVGILIVVYTVVRRRFSGDYE